jgi:hypothetical protein
LALEVPIEEATLGRKICDSETDGGRKVETHRLRWLEDVNQK